MNQQLEMYRGNSTEWDVTVTQNFLPVDLAGASLWFTAKTSKDSPTEVFQKTIGDGITVTDEPGGMIRIKMAPIDTSNLAAATISLHYDLEIETAGGDVYNLADGRLIVKPDITVR